MNWQQNVTGIGGAYDITASAKRGRLSISDNNRPTEPPLVYEGYMIAGFRNHGDVIDIYMMDDTTVVLIAYPL